MKKGGWTDEGEIKRERGEDGKRKESQATKSRGRGGLK